MSITLGWWLVPLAITLLIWFGGRRYIGVGENRSVDFSVDGIVELFLLIPILCVWLAYFVILHFFGSTP